jgi:hypothetical protein
MVHRSIPEGGGSATGVLITDGSRWPGGDGAIVVRIAATPLVKTDHIPKVNFSNQATAVFKLVHCEGRNRSVPKVGWSFLEVVKVDAVRNASFGGILINP